MKRLELSQKIAAALAAAGSGQFADALADLLAWLVPSDDQMVVVFRRSAAPELLLDISRGTKASENIAFYLNGAFLLDPFYRAFMDNATIGCHLLRELAPDGFRASEYFRQHYQRTGIHDELGLLLPIDDDTVLHASVARRESSGRFSNAQKCALCGVEPILAEIVRVHARDAGPAPITLNTQLDLALQDFGRRFLTERETEVIQLLLRGHATRSIAERLGISAETVKLHRKHAYAKLDISSQAELFHLFIDALGSAGDYAGGDPLSGYLDHKSR